VQSPIVLADMGVAPRAEGFSGRLRHWGTVARQNTLGVLGLVIIIVFVGAAIFAPLIAPYSPTALSGHKNEAMSSHHLFGTEVVGRDIFSRVVYGGRISM